MAYAALRSLAQILHQTLNRDCQYLTLDEKQQIESLFEIITCIQKDFSSQKITQDDEEREIRDAAYIVEDIIESRIIERFRTESAGNEDGSTEKKLVRFNVLENWIVASSNLASSISVLEIVGVGGVEKPCAFQTIYGIRQLARTLRFKTWFLDIDVLVNGEKRYLVARKNAYMEAIEEQYLEAREKPYMEVKEQQYLDARMEVIEEQYLDARVKPYVDAANRALKRLATHGTKIVIIRYSSMWESEIMMKLRRLGFDTSLFVGAITIEDLRRYYILRANDARFEEPGPSNIDITSGAEFGVTKKNFFTSLLCATWCDGDAPEEYKSPTTMAGVDAADRCIVVTRYLRDINVANATGISSIFMSDHFGGTIYHGHHEVRDLAARFYAHPTYLLPSFTW